MADNQETNLTVNSASAETNNAVTPVKVEEKKHIVVQETANSDVSEPESDDNYDIDQDENLLNDFPRDTEEIELLHLKIRSIAALGFENFPKVKTVCLRQNLVTSLEGLEDLPETLEELDLYDNRISHVGSHLKHFKNITSLDLSFNKIRHLKNFEHLKDLEKLYICQNKISKIENLADFSKLTYLELGANRIRKIEGLEKLVNLEQLWLGKNKIAKLEGLETLTKLRILSIQSNRIVKLEGLEALTNLEEFYISHNGIEKIEGLDKNLALNIVDISANRIEHIENLSHLINLQELWASGNRFEDFDEIKNELSGIKTLEAVYFEFNPLQRKNPVTYHNKIRLSLGPSLRQIDANYIK